MTAPELEQSVQLQVGGWQLVAFAPGQAPIEISTVRGEMTEIGDVNDEDPFGWTDLTLTFPGLTIFDRPGQGDLEWLVEGADIDLRWTGPVPNAYRYEAFVYEGYVEAFNYTDDGVSVTVKGAMFQVDNDEAKPEYLSQPMPYEQAILRQFLGKPWLRLKSPVIEWPNWWSTYYQPKPRGTLANFVPTGVSKGERWTALLTRSTGSWDKALTSYIQTLLSSMWTERGRWSLDLFPGRRPVLTHRDQVHRAVAGTIVIDPASPGVTVTMSEDWSQSANVFYGQGKSLQGQSYTGQQVSNDGLRTSYKPLAALPQTYPDTDRNGWFNPAKMRREQSLQLQPGLDQRGAEQVGKFQLRLFSEPGLVGDITLKADVRLFNKELLSRFIIRAGMSVQLPGAFGDPQGVFLHVSKVSRNLKEGTVTLTVDSKYRDQLTVNQVQLRGRDALAVPRLLLGGLYTPPVPDQLFPWSYGDGSGYIPSSPAQSAVRMFDGMPSDVEFPWSDWTTQHPPRLRSFRNCYVRIGPKSANADDNWAYDIDRQGGKFGIPIRMAQAGSVRMLQIGAYDADGNVMEVPFHVSFYSSYGVNVQAMPTIPVGGYDGYPAGQHYPFFPNAWEKFGPSGVQKTTEQTLAVSSAALVRGYGTHDVKAGYWPGSSTSGDPTGLLLDEEQWEIQVPTGNGTGDWGVNPFSTKQGATYAGYMYMMIYCDAQDTDEVFFAGRCFRVEPGQGE